MNILSRNKRPKPLVLLILDGLGAAHPNPGNAVTIAKTPNLDQLWPMYSHTYLEASGNYVGLPTGVTGNSEVGHLSLGAGSIVYQEIARIDNQIKTKEFFENETFKQAIKHVKKNNSKLHFIGLVSNGNVHASINHLIASLKFCKKENLKKDDVIIHAFTDGRDTPPQNAGEYLDQLESKTRWLKIGKIASIIGRYYAMDRDDRWDRTQLAYDLIVNGKGTEVKNWQEALEKSYKDKVTDEYVKPFVITEKGEPVGKVNPGDAVIFFNYRADRAVQLSKAFVDDKFTYFDRKKIDNLFFAGFSNYQKGIVMNRADEDIEDAGSESEFVQKAFNEEIQHAMKKFPENQIFPPEVIEYPLGRLISESGLSQLRLSESEKFPHVTYFFNCRNKGAFEREDRTEIDSPEDVATYDLKPEMSNYEVTDKLIKAIDEKKYDFILVNFALTDMVAHTGNLEASVKSVEVADECIGRIAPKVLAAGGELIITADHGNIEEMINLQTGGIDTKHSINRVPFIYVSGRTKEEKELPAGMLADIAPTILTSLRIDIPDSMKGRNLLV